MGSEWIRWAGGGWVPVLTLGREASGLGALEKNNNKKKPNLTEVCGHSVQKSGELPGKLKRGEQPSKGPEERNYCLKVEVLRGWERRAKPFRGRPGQSWDGWGCDSPGKPVTEE